MKRLAIVMFALIPVLASCHGTSIVPLTQAEVDAISINTSNTIKRGEVGNAISGTVELPINIRALATITDGAPPVTIHAFRTTGQLIREAKVSVFWRDDKSVGYVVDDVPTDRPVVLAATVEPGIVVRTLVPKSSRENPSRGQTIDKMSEMVVLEAYLAGMIPPVGLGGTAEVLLQGGLNPAAATIANAKASEYLTQFAKTEWGKGVGDSGAAAAAVKVLAETQAKAADVINTGTVDTSAVRSVTQEVFIASLAAQQSLSAMRTQADERAKQSAPGYDVANLLQIAAAALHEAAMTDIPASAAVVPTTGSFHIAQIPIIKSPFPYKTSKPSQVNLGNLYKELDYLAASNAGFSGPNGGPFTEEQIDEAFQNGKGPYRTSCSQISFSGAQNCTIVTNPVDKSREVLVTRQANLFEAKLLKLEEAYAANNEEGVRQVLQSHPAVLNFIKDDKARWTSPVGTWRLRLLQDTGEGLWGGAGWPVLSDAEMYIAPPKGGEANAVASGEFLGLISIWMPNIFESGPDVLDNFAMRFKWDSKWRTLNQGEIRGERRSSDGVEASRQDYSASFEGKMVEGNRIKGYWFNDERDMAGRYEMIRGTARYSI